MARTTKAELEKINQDLSEQLESCRDRSRSRKAKAKFVVEPIQERTLRALDLCCKRDRDHIIEEQRQTIARQAQEIVQLRLGPPFYALYIAWIFKVRATSGKRCLRNHG